MTGADSRFKPCILIPVYNHAQPLPGLVERLAGHGLPGLLIDDGSDAACAAVMCDLAERHPWLRHVRQERNGGKGSAVKLGLRLAAREGYTHALQIDADGQHDPAELGKFLELAARRPEAMITGLPRFDASIPRNRYYGRYLTHVWVWINTLSFCIRDSLCGYRAYPLAPCVALLDSANLGDRMDFDTEILVRLYWQEVPILSIPVRVRYPEDGISHFRLREDNILISRMHARLFFGMLRRLPALLRRHCR
jgi:glycosyltransferase involved in cell wall biosynthesis